MRLLVSCLAWSIALLAACGSDPDHASIDRDADVHDSAITDSAPTPTPPTPPGPTPVPPPPPDPSITDCDVATACPVAMPAERAPCEGSFNCRYGARDFRCSGGEMQDVAASFDAGGVPYLAESCPLPFDGTLTDATIEIGPATGDWHAYASGERIDPIVGPQGGTMMFFRVNVVGDDVPDCVQMNATLTLDGGDPAPAIVAVRLHCGRSYRMVGIFADSPCEPGDHDVRVSVELEGIGTTTLDLVTPAVTDMRACRPAG